MRLTALQNKEDTMRSWCHGKEPLADIRIAVVDVVAIADELQTLRAKVADRSQRLRDEFAKAALIAQGPFIGDQDVVEAQVRRAYQVADAMLKERENRLDFTPRVPTGMPLADPGKVVR